MSELEPFLRSGEGLVGYVHLLLSLYFESGKIPTDGRFKANFLRWMSEEFICASSFEDFAVELVSTLQMTSDCGSTGDYKSYPPAVLWNAPTASITEEDYFATWNVSYPVYDWGDSSDLQQGLQVALDSKIINGELELPWEDASISIWGLEQETFDLPEPTDDDIVDNMTSTGNNSTDDVGVEERLQEGVLSLDPATARTVEYIGAILLVFHTMMLIIVHLAGQSYTKKLKQAKEAEKPLLDAEGLDNMLLITKDHKMQKSSAADLAPLILPSTYATNNTNKTMPASPTRSLISAASRVSSTNNAGESLFPPMDDDDDDEISEAGTEVIIDESIDSGSNHSISSAVLEDAGSVHSKPRSQNGDDHSISKNSVGSAGSRNSFAIPTNIGTILGNVDDDEDNVSDIMLL